MGNPLRFGFVVLSFSLLFANPAFTRTCTRDDSISQVKQYVSWGAGPRAGQNLILGAKVRAVMNGRPLPSLEDVRAIAHPVLAPTPLLYSPPQEG